MTSDTILRWKTGIRGGTLHSDFNGFKLGDPVLLQSDAVVYRFHLIGIWKRPDGAVRAGLLDYKKRVTFKFGMSRLRLLEGSDKSTHIDTAECKRLCENWSSTEGAEWLCSSDAGVDSQDNESGKREAGLSDRLMQGSNKKARKGNIENKENGGVEGNKGKYSTKKSVRSQTSGVTSQQQQLIHDLQQQVKECFASKKISEAQLRKNEKAISRLEQANSRLKDALVTQKTKMMKTHENTMMKMHCEEASQKKIIEDTKAKLHASEQESKEARLKINALEEKVKELNKQREDDLEVMNRYADNGRGGIIAPAKNCRSGLTYVLVNSTPTRGLQPAPSTFWETSRSLPLEPAASNISLNNCYAVPWSLEHNAAIMSSSLAPYGNFSANRNN